jgi:molybdopterin-guanine dinucleotide biosynthesis protein A
MRAAVVLAGGRARRLGGVDKALVDVGGTTMLDRVLAAAAPNCEELVVVGPPRTTAVAGVRFTIESSPGGGPVPAVAAGLDEAPVADVVVVLAVDLPLLTSRDVATLCAGLDAGDTDAVAALDHRGRPTPLLAASRAEVLRAAVDNLGSGDPAARLLPAATAVVDLGLGGTLNVNEPADVERAERAADERKLRDRPTGGGRAPGR